MFMNWAKESSTLTVSRLMLEVVLNDWVIDTKDTPYWSNSSTSLAKSASARVRRDQDQHRAAQDQAGFAIRFVEEQDDIGGRSRPPLRPIMYTGNAHRCQLNGGAESRTAAVALKLR
jgi:hypothetical protein